VRLSPLQTPLYWQRGKISWSVFTLATVFVAPSGRAYKIFNFAEKFAMGKLFSLF